MPSRFVQSILINSVALALVISSERSVALALVISSERSVILCLVFSVDIDGQQLPIVLWFTSLYVILSDSILEQAL